MKKHLTYLFCLWAFILSAQTPTRSGRDYAVFFYVTDFQTGWVRLPETKTEAEALKTELETNFNFTCELVANPTKQQMLDKIRQYNERLTENDQLLYFFSMHGHFDAAGDRGYLIGKDGLLNDEYGNTWLNYDDLRTYLSRCKAKHILLALDACHSGSFGIRNKSRPDAPDNESVTDCATKVNRTMKYTGRQYCTSGNKDAKTPAKSLFAARFLEALRKGGEGGVLRFDDLEYFLGKVDSPKPESGMFGKHDPGGDFIFVRKDACSDEIPKTKNATDQDKALWQTTQQADVLEGYLKYLRECDFCLYTEEAEAAIGRLRSTIPDMVLVRGGTFQMGNNDDDHWSNNKPAHTVTVSDFYLGKYEVTVKEYMAFVEATNSNYPQWLETGSEYNINTGSNDHYKKMGGDLQNPKGPIVGVNWDNIVAYCKWLNQNTGFSYRLPTEAEWEYAAGGGSDNRTIIWAGTSEIKYLKYYANIEGEEDGYAYTAPVGTFQPNLLGLYDMTGNVEELCNDFYDDDYYKNSASNNPNGPVTGLYHVMRGGGWNDYPPNFRVTNRYGIPLAGRYGDLGFRLARSKHP